jgi:dipeptidyl aminopeptidase/acylaminoacyl peptidase
MMHERSVEFSSGGDNLHARWYEPEGIESFPVVLLATGDGPSGSNGQTWVGLIPKFEDKGIGVFLFDFAGLGNSDGERRSLTLSKGIVNLKDAVSEMERSARTDLARLGALGASFGGNVLLACAADLPQIRAIGLKSPCCYLPEAFICEFGRELVEQWREASYLDEVGFDYRAFLDPLTISTYQEASRIAKPVRVVHGGADSIVPVRQSHDLMHYLRQGTLRLIAGADHWYADGDEWELMADDLVAFLETELRSIE